MSEDKKTVVKMAYIYSQEGRWDKAVAEYKKLIKLDPEDFNAQNMLGDVFVKKGEHQPAYESYMVAADAYNRLGQSEKATVVYRKIAKLEANQLSPDAKKKQAIFQKQVDGEAAMEANDLDGAVTAFQAVLKLDPERFEVYQRLGDLYIRKGQSDLAIKQYAEIADIYFKNKLYKKAAPIYKRINELDPSNVEAHAAMGEIHAKSGNESDAKKEYLLIAEAMLKRGDLEAALNYAKKAVALKSIEAYYYLGQVFLLQQKYDDAKSEFEKLLKFKLNHVGALVSMGKVFEVKGQTDEALKHYQRALKVEKNNVDALCAAAALHESKGEASQAASYYAEAATSYSAQNDAANAKLCSDKAASLDASKAAPVAVASPAPSAPQAPAPPAPPPVAIVPEVAPPPAAAPMPAPLPEAAPILAAPRSEPAEAAPASDPAEEMRTLINLADNYVAEESWSEAIELYERVLKIDPNHHDSKEALTHAYAMLGKGARDAVPRPVGPSPEDLAKKAAEEEAQRQAMAEAAAAAQRLEQLKRQAQEEQRQLELLRQQQEEARRKLEEEERIKREAEDAKRAEEASLRHQKDEEDRRRMSEAEMRKALEAEIRKQLEEEMRKKAEDEIRSRMQEEIRQRLVEEKRKADEEGKRRAEEETQRRLQVESKKIDAEKEEVRRRIEEEMRKAIEAQERAKAEKESLEKVETLRKKEEQDSKLRLQQEVLARVQADQKERQSQNQRTIDAIRQKVEEANRAPDKAASAPQASPSAEGEDDDMFMTVAVADIYTKQGLVNEALRIYEKILARDPDNSEVRGKLDALKSPGGVKGESPAPAPSAPAAAAPEKKASPDPDAKKKSKVSYL